MNKKSVGQDSHMQRCFFNILLYQFSPLRRFWACSDLRALRFEGLPEGSWVLIWRGDAFPNLDKDSEDRNPTFYYKGSLDSFWCKTIPGACWLQLFCSSCDCDTPLALVGNPSETTIALSSRPLNPKPYHVRLSLRVVYGLSGWVESHPVKW